MSEITTTLNRIREHGPCKKGWEKLLKHLGKTQADDEPLPFSVILKSNGIEDALWCCRAEPQHSREWRLFAVWCARQVQHLLKDQRSIDALDVAERHAQGNATDEELQVAWNAARVAAWAWSKSAAVAAACYAACYAAQSAAVAAARVAALYAAGASRAATRNAQAAKFLKVVGGSDA